jgi:membrane-associated phospholipid phosphatase
VISTNVEWVPVLVVFLAGLLPGIAIWLVVSRWPNLDPASPRATTHAVGQEIARHPALTAFVRRRMDPATAAGLALTVAIVVATGGVVAAGVLLVMIQTDSGFARWDQAAGQWGADHATDLSTNVLRHLSMLGGTAGVVTLAVIVSLVEFVRTRHRALPVFLAVVLIGITIVVNVTKLIVGRDRPAIRQLTGFSSSSFPSGHAATAAAAFAAFALLLGLRRSHRVKAALAGAAVGIATAVAGTRVLLGVHWFTDVLAGVAVGWAWFAVCSIAFGGRLLRFGAPVEAAERATDVEDLSGQRSG